MTATVEIKYVALKPLPLQTEEGERLVVQPGDVIPAALCGSWVERSIEAGKVTEVVTEGLDGFSDEELMGEIRRRGLQTTRAKRAA